MYPYTFLYRSLADHQNIFHMGLRNAQPHFPPILRTCIARQRSAQTCIALALCHGGCRNIGRTKSHTWWIREDQCQSGIFFFLRLLRLCLWWSGNTSYSLRQCGDKTGFARSGQVFMLLEMCIHLGCGVHALDLQSRFDHSSGSWYSIAHGSISTSRSRRVRSLCQSLTCSAIYCHSLPSSSSQRVIDYSSELRQLRM